MPSDCEIGVNVGKAHPLVLAALCARVDSKRKMTGILTPNWKLREYLEKA